MSGLPASPTVEAAAPVVGDRQAAVLRLFLAGVVLFLGASGLVYEYVLSTLATHLLGNSIEQFSVIIALMLFAMGVAGLAQRWMSQERVVDRFVQVEILLGLIGGASAIGLYLAFAWTSHFKLVLYGLAMGIGFLIGLEIPLLMRWNAKWQPRLRDNLSQVFCLDYVGALVGALVWAWLLLPVLPLDRISLILGAVNLVIAALTLGVFWRHLHRPMATLGWLVAASVALGALLLAAPTLRDNARQHLFTNPIRHQVHSPYQDIVITGVGQRLSLWLDGHLQLDSEDEFIYHELLVHPALMAFQQGTGRAPERVLILGGGDGCAAREARRWPSVTEILVVDLDPAVTELARTYEPLVILNGGALLDERVGTREATGISEGPLRTLLVPPASAKQARTGELHELATVHVRNLDADVFLRDAAGSERWDVIVADFPDPRTPELAKLYSVEFYARTLEHLASGGVLVTQAGSPWTSRRAYWAIEASLREAGFDVTPLQGHVPTFGPWGWHLARLGPAPDPHGAAPVETRFLTAETLAAARVLPPPMARPEPAPSPSTQLEPSVYQLYNAGEPLRAPHFYPGTAESR